MGDSRQADAIPLGTAGVDGAGGSGLDGGRGGSVRLAAQVGVALACAALASAVAWRHVGDHLTLRTDIVGSTIFYNYDVYRLLDHFYIVIVLLPGLAAALFLLIARWGPLAWRGPRSVWPPALSVQDTVLRNPPETRDSTPEALSRSPAAPARGEPTASPTRLFILAARLALPAIVIAGEVEIGRSPQAQNLSLPLGILALAAYPALVAVVSVVLRHRSLEGPDVWSAANAVLAIAVIPMLLLVSASTAVSVASDHRIVHYPWLPLWLALLATLAALALVAWGLRRGGWQAARRVERLVLTALVGPVSLFLATAVLLGPLPQFIGYDDTMGMTGAQLLFGHGLWPWRDVFLLHGFLSDALYGQIGMWVFGATAWGSDSGLTFLVAPLTVISLYAFIVYFARRNYALVIGGCLAVVLGVLVSWPETRFLLLPPAFILLDRVLRRGSWGRCWALMAWLVLMSVVTPESGLLVLGMLATLMVAELVHRRWAEPILQSFSRTFRCGVAGMTLTVAWLGYLLATGSLSGFLGYYSSVLTGHELWGALSVGLPFPSAELNAEFFIPLALFLLTAARVVWKIQRRTSWRTVDWILVASATFVPLYYQEALDRFNVGQIDILFQAMVPLVLLWVFELVSLGDSWFLRAATSIRAPTGRRRDRTSGGGGRSARTRARTWSAMTPLGLVAAVCVAFLAPQSLSSWADLPGGFHPSAPTDPPAGLPLGYTIPGAVDTTQLDDLAAVLDRYAGPTAPVFDFTNELGVTYFLLNRVPAAPFYHVGAAQTVAAQQIEVTALERSRPPLVIFNDTTFGLPDYDGIWSMEREFLISQYILDNYQPILDVEGQIIMLRDSLLSTAPPPPPLAVAPITTDLYFTGEMACVWGDVPDFLDPPSAAEIAGGRRATMKLASQPLIADGWAYDTAANRPAVAVLAVSDGVVIAQTQPTLLRPDVATALNDAQSGMSGFSLPVPVPPGTAVTFYALNADRTVTPLAPAGPGPLPSVVSTSSGTTYRVVSSSDAGHIDQVGRGTILDLSLPGSGSLSPYQWLEFESPTGFGQATIEVTDQTMGAQPSHTITFQTLPSAGHTVFLRVGSCIQWHGYQAGELHLVTSGAPADMSVRLLT